MANLSVTYEDMQIAAGKLRDGQKTITADLGRLRSLMTDLVNGGFKTEKASTTFDATYTEYNKGAEQVIGALDQLATYLEKAAKAYGDTDQALASGLTQSS